MVYVKNKNEEGLVYFPRTSDCEEKNLVLRIHSELTNKTYDIEVEDVSTRKNYYRFLLNFTHYDYGEFTYFILNGNVVLETGLLRLGEVSDGTPEVVSYSSSTEVKTYDSSFEVVQYRGDGDARFKLQKKDVEYTENGTYEVTPDPGYYGLKSVGVNVDVPVSGHTDEELEEAYASGITNGIAEQKSKLIGLDINSNGTYTRPDGWSAVTVNVPTGSTINNQNKTVNILNNGSTSVTFDSGYTGLGTVGINVSVPTGHSDAEMVQAYDSGYTNGYTSGNTDGYNSGKVAGYNSGYTNGYTSGKTDGYNDGYASGTTDGYNAGKAVGYESGYTNGYLSGKTDGYDSGYTSGKTDGYNSGYTNGYASGTTDGYNVGYASGTTDGYNAGKDAGYTSGITYQKSLLASTAVTSNGTYTSENGFSSVTVNVQSYEYYSLTVYVSATTDTSGLTNNAVVTLSTARQTITQVYNGLPLVFNVLPGFPYTVSFSDVQGYSKPNPITGISYWGATWSETGNYENVAPSGYTSQYLTLEFVSGGTVAFNAHNNISRTIEYSLNDGAWTQVTFSGVNVTRVSVAFGDKMRLRGNYNVDGYAVYTGGNYNYCSINCYDSARYKLYGNFMSLLYSDTFADKNTLELHTSIPFYKFFQMCVDAENMVLPATSLTESCYAYMFANNGVLTKAPTLPATTLVNQCYARMFNMCTSLQYIKCLATDKSASYCTYEWVKDVPSSGGTFVKAAGTTWSTGNDGIPRNWTVEEE